MHGDWPATGAKASGRHLRRRRSGVRGRTRERVAVLAARRDQGLHRRRQGRRLRPCDPDGQRLRRLCRPGDRQGRPRHGTTHQHDRRSRVQHPGTNVAEVGGAVAGLLDREFTPRTDGAGGPGVYVSRRRCFRGPQVRDRRARSMIKTDVSGYRIGDLLVDNRARRDLRRHLDGGQEPVPAQVLRRRPDDGVRPDPGQPGLHHPELRGRPGGRPGQQRRHAWVTATSAEYEEEFMVDRCFGDHVLETMLYVGRNLG